MPKGVPTKNYEGEFKQKVVEDVRNNGLSYREAMRKYDVAGCERIKKRERIYLEKGAEGLYIERRGRSSAVTGTRGGRKPQLDKRIEEDLIAENQRLRTVILWIFSSPSLSCPEQPSITISSSKVSPISMQRPRRQSPPSTTKTKGVMATDVSHRSCAAAALC